MSLEWITNPDFKLPYNDTNFETSIRIRQKELLAIDKDNDVECCRICGNESNLSKEHTPSKAAFNKNSYVSYTAVPKRTLMSRVLQWKTKTIQGGVKIKSLCVECNNNTGSWYNPSYIKFSRACAPYAKPINATKMVKIKTNIYPSRLLKQALVHICSVSQPGLCKKYTILRDLMKKKDSTIDLTPLKVGFFINVSNIGRSTGVTISVNTDRKEARLVSEFVFWPLGWILTFDGSPFEGTLDVTEWSRYKNNDKISLPLDVPCQSCPTAYPGDFRSPDEFSGKK